MSTREKKKQAARAPLSLADISLCRGHRPYSVYGEICTCLPDKHIVVGYFKLTLQDILLLVTLLCLEKLNQHLTVGQVRTAISPFNLSRYTLPERASASKNESVLACIY